MLWEQSFPTPMLDYISRVLSDREAFLLDI